MQLLNLHLRKFQYSMHFTSNVHVYTSAQTNKTNEQKCQGALIHTQIVTVKPIALAQI
jgi:hypothetical protein